MTTAITSSAMPAHVNFFRLCQLRGALKMEKIGLKGRAGALRPKIAAELGLKARDTYDTFIAEVQKRIDACHAKNEAPKS